MFNLKKKKLLSGMLLTCSRLWHYVLFLGNAAAFYHKKWGFHFLGFQTWKNGLHVQFCCTTGVLQDVLYLMANETLKMTAQERVCVLSFDELNVDSRIYYDQAEDKILGPHSNVQVVMVWGLFVKWKYPVYFDFDVWMTVALLKDDCSPRKIWI